MPKDMCKHVREAGKSPRLLICTNSKGHENDHAQDMRDTVHYWYNEQGNYPSVNLPDKKEVNHGRNPG